MEPKGNRAARLWLLAAMVLLLASSPALVGTWVYDDWGTAELDSMDDVEDLLAVFQRDSSSGRSGPMTLFGLPSVRKPMIALCRTG